MNKAKIRKLTAVLLCVAIIAVAGAAYVFLTENAAHECTGDGCRICLALYFCVSHIGFLLASTGAAVLALYFLLFGRGIAFSVKKAEVFYSPVMYKEKLTE